MTDHALYPGFRGNILAVDDKPNNLRLLSSMLTVLGYKVRSVTEGTMAITAALASPPDIILLDINLPEIDGYSICEQLKSDTRTRDIPVIFISILDEVVDKVRAFEVGGADYITKPFHTEEVLARIENQLAMQRLRQQLVERNAQLQQEIQARKAAEIALQKAVADLQQLVHLDGLTRVANRRRFDEHLLQEWHYALQSHCSLALILCDLDFFKHYNDTYGHQAADQALCKVAATVQSVIKRPRDLVARYGGEEFAVILANTSLQGAEQVARDIYECISQLQIPHDGSSISKYLTVSIGVTAIVPTAAFPVDQLVAVADRALYRAKNQGRNCIVSEACDSH